MIRKKRLCERCRNYFEVLERIRVYISVSVGNDDCSGKYEWSGEACEVCRRSLMNRVFI